MKRTIIGAIAGDIIGSRFEFDRHNIKRKDFRLFAPRCAPTDDSVMTLAVAQALLESGDRPEALGACAVRWMQRIGRSYPGCGFGGRFYDWIFAPNPAPYQSWGNGAAMRISPVGFYARTEEEVKALSRIVTAVSHDHPESFNAAEAVAMAIFLARQGAHMEAIRARIERDYYRIGFTLDEIRRSYHFDVSCRGSVPQALEAFFESTDYEDAIRNAISIGGDSDTIAAIIGGIAAAYYGVPRDVADAARGFLDERQRDMLDRWDEFIRAR